MKHHALARLCRLAARIYWFRALALGMGLLAASLAYLLWQEQGCSRALELRVQELEQRERAGAARRRQICDYELSNAGIFVKIGDEWYQRVAFAPEVAR